MSNSIQFLSIKELAEMMKQKKISSIELFKEVINNAKTKNKSFNFAIEIFDNLEKISANVLQEKKSQSILQSIPYLPKDVIAQSGERLSCASKILSNFVSPYDATVITRLKKSGAISIGRGNCDEFAMGSTGETSHYGSSKNPWDCIRSPGGSSSGPAVAVAAGVVPFSLGSETGGSVRLPAVWCGLTGLKPTYGAISRYGLVAYASSFDQVGIFAHSASDIAIVFSEIAGEDASDSTTLAHSWDNDFANYASYDDENIKKIRIGIVKNAFYADGMKENMQSVLLDALRVYEAAGVKIEYVDIPSMNMGAAVYFVMSRSEAASNLSRYDGVRYGYRSKEYDDLDSMYRNTRSEGFGKTVQDRIFLGNYLLLEEHSKNYFKNAIEVRESMKKEFFEALSSYDALFLPVSATPATKFGEFDSDPLALGLLDYFTCPANITGLPAISLPCGYINNLPVGFQLMGGLCGEKKIIALADWFQQKTFFHKEYPKLLL